MTKDIQGKELKVGATVAVAGQGEIYLGRIVKIWDNNDQYFRYVRDNIGGNSRYCTQERLDDMMYKYKLMKLDGSGFITIRSQKRLLVYDGIQS